MNASFALDATNAEAVAQICRRLDGIPLAIELAAARVPRRSHRPRSRARLDDRFRLLARRPAHRGRAPPDAAGGRSTGRYDLLDEPEQLLFDRLSVFAGGFDARGRRSRGRGRRGRRRRRARRCSARWSRKSLVVADDRTGRHALPAVRDDPPVRAGAARGATATANGCAVVTPIATRAFAETVAAAQVPCAAPWTGNGS